MSSRKQHWSEVLARCARDTRETGEKPRTWYERNYPDESWKTAERYLSKKNIAAYLEQASGTEADAISLLSKQSKTAERRGGKRERAGAPKQNNNARTHGIYSRYYSDEDREILQEASQIDHLDYELRVARVQLARAIKKQQEIDQFHSKRGDNQKEAFLGLPVTEFNTQIGTDGGNEETRRSVPDTDVIIDRLLGRISHLMDQKTKLEQRALLNKVEQQTVIQTTLTRLQNGDITAIEAGMALEAKLIPLPVTLAAMIKIELATEAEEGFEGGGVTAEEIASRALEIRELKEKQRKEFMEQREKELQAMNEEMGIS